MTGAAVEIALRRINIILNECIADVFKTNVSSSNRCRIDPHADGRFLIALNGYQANAANFAEFLRQDCVGKVIHFFQRQRNRN